MAAAALALWFNSTLWQPSQSLAPLSTTPTTAGVHGLILLPPPQPGQLELPPSTRSVSDVAASSGRGYLGAEACKECHAERYESFARTAHHLTSRLGIGVLTTVAGSFQDGANTVQTSDPRLQFRLEGRPEGLWQTAEVAEDGCTARHSERIDIAIGSGKLGQTYLYWRGDRLWELPVSYLTRPGKWVNSPGYRDGLADFTRPILPRCLDCHATWFQVLPGGLNAYRRDGFVLGVSCERCHGPGAAHVEHHRRQPGEAAGRHIVHPGRLEPSRQIEICARCHSPIGAVAGAPFAYNLEMPLLEVPPQHAGLRPSAVGVHSNNQTRRLQMSRCYLESPSMTCVTCHDPHVLERGETRVFSARCQRCHDAARCGWAERVGERIRDDCVTCHLPEVDDPGTPFAAAGQVEFPRLREHRVAVYREAAQRVIEGLGASTPEGRGVRR